MKIFSTCLILHCNNFIKKKIQIRTLKTHNIRKIYVACANIGFPVEFWEKQISPCLNEANKIFLGKIKLLFFMFSRFRKRLRELLLEFLKSIFRIFFNESRASLSREQVRKNFSLRNFHYDFLEEVCILKKITYEILKCWNFYHVCGSKLLRFLISKIFFNFLD